MASPWLSLVTGPRLEPFTSLDPRIFLRSLRTPSLCGSARTKIWQLMLD